MADNPHAIHDRRNWLSDLAAGLTAAAVLLPQAIAFGIVLFVQIGLSSAQGALAGLLGAASLCLISGLLGRTTGLISGPTGPAAILLSGALAGLAQMGLGAQALLMSLFAITVLAGCFQLAIAAVGGGQLVKYLPFPVVAGFMTGSSLQIFKSQFAFLFDGSMGSLVVAWHWIPLIACVATMLTIHFVPRRFKRVPGSLAGVLLGTLLFHVLIIVGPGGLVPEAWVVGRPSTQSHIQSISIEALRGLPMAPILTAALALALLASLNTLLVSVIAPADLSDRRHTQRELLAQGIGQIVVGAVGGVGGSATTGATMVAVRSGGRRWAGVFAGLVFTVFLFALAPIGSAIPVGVLAGVLLYIALTMIELKILGWLRRPQTRIDAGIAILVTLITVVYNLVGAIAAGFTIAVLAFLRLQAQAPVILRRVTGRLRQSLRQRTSAQRACLEQHGDQIILVELRGNLFFATADRLYADLLSDLEQARWVVLHMRRVTQIDLTALRILHQIAERMQRQGGELLFCEVHSEIGIGQEMDAAFEKVTRVGGGLGVKTFIGSDEALEYAENALLTSVGQPPLHPTQRVALADMDLCRGMTPAAIRAFDACLRRRRFDAGAKVFNINEPAESLYLVVQGEIEIRLPTTRHHYKRMRIYGAGQMFGEIAFLSPGPRTADAIALNSVEVLVLDRSRFAGLETDHPDVAILLLTALGNLQAEMLRRMTDQLQHFVQG